jgi:hypothetical protein
MTSHFTSLPGDNPAPGHVLDTLEGNTEKADDAGSMVSQREGKPDDENLTPGLSLEEGWTRSCDYSALDARLLTIHD